MKISVTIFTQVEIEILKPNLKFKYYLVSLLELEPVVIPLSLKCSNAPKANDGKFSLRFIESQ